MPLVSSRTTIRSTPSTTSRRRVEASSRAGRIFTGRRLAKSPRPASRSPAGRLSGALLARQGVVLGRADGAHQHRIAGPAGAPGVLLRQGERPQASIAAPAYAAARRSSRLTAVPEAHRPSSSWRATARISGPMPSPASRVIGGGRHQGRQSSLVREATCRPRRPQRSPPACSWAPRRSPAAAAGG